MPWRITLYTGPAITAVLRSILAVHNFIFTYLRSILILSSVLRMLLPSGVLCCRYSGKGFYSLLKCHSCHWFRQSLLRYNQMCSKTPSSVINFFQNFSMKIIFIFSTERIDWYILPFEKWDPNILSKLL